jgi:hypothetical protein
MRQRGRPSSVVTFPIVDGSPSRLQPPASLRKAEAAIFAQVINACSPHHFDERDLPLLISYVQATVMAHRMAGHPDKAAIWERATRLQMALATKLRITPQARMDRTLAHLQPGNTVSYYDRMKDESP